MAPEVFPVRKYYPAFFTYVSAKLKHRKESVCERGNMPGSIREIYSADTV